MGRGQGPAPRDLRPAGPDRALPPRGTGRGPGLAPERGRGDRRRRGRRAPLHRLRVRRRRDAQAAHRPARAPAARRGRRLRHRGRARARRRPRAPPRPPRRQAAERAHRQRGAGEGHRLRHRSRARAGRAHEDRPRARHHRLRLARAGDGQGRRRALGHLLARDPALRDARRRGPVPGRQPGRRGDEARQRANARRAEAAQGRLLGAGGSGRARDREEAGQALPGHERDARRPRERARGGGRARRAVDRRGDHGARLGPAPAADRPVAAKSRSRVCCSCWQPPPRPC